MLAKVLATFLIFGFVISGSLTCSNINICRDCLKSNCYFLKTAHGLICVGQLRAALRVRKVYVLEDCIAIEGKSSFVKEPNVTTDAFVKSQIPPKPSSYSDFQLQQKPSDVPDKKNAFLVLSSTIVPQTGNKSSSLALENTFSSRGKETPEKVTAELNGISEIRKGQDRNEFRWNQSHSSLNTNVSHFNNFSDIPEPKNLSALEFSQVPNLTNIEIPVSISHNASGPVHFLNKTFTCTSKNFSIANYPEVVVKQGRIYIEETPTRFKAHRQPRLLLRLLKNYCNNYILVQRHISTGGKSADIFKKALSNNPMKSFPDTCFKLTCRFRH